MTTLDYEGPVYLFTRCWPSHFEVHHGVLRASVVKMMCRLPHHAAGSLVRDHPFDLFLVGFVQNRIAIELAFALRTFGSQDVALERVSALDLARPCLLEALGRSAVSLELWHSDLSITTYNAQIGPALRASVALHFIHYNFARVHKTLRITPAMAAGIADHVWSLEDIAMLSDHTFAPVKRGPYKKRGTT